jgi:transcriptional regulator with XRE-family HTH domain
MECVCPTTNQANGRDIVSRFGRRLRKLRTDAGHSQEDFAAHVGISRAYISDLELGKREICLKNLELIAMGLKVRPDELLRGL